MLRSNAVLTQESIFIFKITDQLFPDIFRQPFAQDNGLIQSNALAIYDFMTP